jgi:hypothetical protein
MSAFLYGRWTRSSQTEPSFAPAADTGKTPVQQAADFATKLAAVIPADVLTVYGFVLASACFGARAVATPSAQEA